MHALFLCVFAFVFLAGLFDVTDGWMNGCTDGRTLLGCTDLALRLASPTVSLVCLSLGRDGTDPIYGTPIHGTPICTCYLSPSVDVVAWRDLT